VRDLSVMVGGTEYDKTAGFGWRRITDKSMVDFNVLTLDKKQITYQQDYKLIVVYNDSVTTSAEITIKNYDSDYACKIEQVTTDEDIKLQITNSKNDKVLVGNWYKSMPDGSYVAVEDGEKQSSILVKDYLVYSYINFYCEVYDYEQNELIGVLYHTIYNSETKEDITITYIGEDTYRYDANGDITIEDSEKERTL
jgi:hypothetical protein